MKKIILMLFLVSASVFSEKFNEESYSDNVQSENFFNTLKKNIHFLVELHSKNKESLKEFYQANKDSEIFMSIIENNINSIEHSLIKGDFLNASKKQAIESILNEIYTSRHSLEFYLQSHILNLEIKKYSEYLISYFKQLEDDITTKL